MRFRLLAVFAAMLAAFAAAIIGFMLLVGRVMPAGYAVRDVQAQQTMRFAEGVIRFEDRGTGDDALLFLHGFNAQLGQWQEVWDLLADAPGRQLRVDIPGYGASDWSGHDFGLPAQGKRVVALLDRLGIRSVRLAGTSMGGALAAWLAAEYPERVTSVALFAPSGYPGSLRYSGFYGRILRPGVLHDVAQWLARTKLYAYLYPQSRASAALSVTASYGETWAQALPRIRAPTVIIWSVGDDTVTYERAAARVQTAIADSALITLAPDAGHSIPASRPDISAAVLRLLEAGVSPRDIAAHLPPDVWRPGDRSPSNGG